MSGDVEVCIVSFDSGATLAATVRHLVAVAPDVGIAVQEHGTDPDARREVDAVVAEVASTVRVRDDPTNPGFAAGCNALAAGSTAEWLVFLNPDAELVTWPWTDLDPPRGTIVGPEMIESGDPGRHYGVRYGIREEIGRSWLRRRGPRPDGAGFVSGAALLVDRASFERVGGFDEGYFLFYEDIDLCLRANAAGVTTVIDPRWQVRHAGAHSTRPRFGASLQWSYESACRFHGSRGSSLAAYRSYVVADAALRALRAAVIRDRDGRGAYVGLLRRAAGDLVRRPSPGPPGPDETPRSVKGR